MSSLGFVESVKYKYSTSSYEEYAPQVCVYQMLSEMRLLEAVETLWNIEDADILSTTNDVFAFIVEANPSMVREFCLSEAKLGQVSGLVG